jgi:hypothetical protein
VIEQPWVRKKGEERRGKERRKKGRNTGNNNCFLQGSLAHPLLVLLTLPIVIKLSLY